ncbi:LOW QUALITY PROTEIN: transcription factor jun-D-like [Mauremys reevesii]|uniref:LOW QUALITY PROTEIN: transcription factor jun-D-like n=1 Tax=Mauremys reevesii TaxID=260615 RepID=UPI00193EC72A|nr:LOW QUALITY PROTEIN: transcription factor jun-D-like [Mauremys reevesii]
MSGGRSGRAAVKMEAPFYPEEGLELLPDFVPLPGFGSGPGAGVEAAGHKLLLGAGKKREMAAGAAASPSALPGSYTLRPPGGTRSGAALRLIPAAAPPGSAAGGGAGGRGGPEAALLAAGSPAELPLLKLPPAADLEQLLIQGSPGLGPASPCPAAAPPPAAGPFLYRQQVTQEQEGFADGFVKALADLQAEPAAGGAAPGALPARRRPARRLHHPRQLQPGRAAQPRGRRLLRRPAGPALPRPRPAGAGQRPPPAPGAARALEEPQTVPEAPPQGEAGSSAPTPPSLSPLDAESQERLKAERKRLRNRIAASKCRRRKLERIARLEEKVKALKGQNAELAATASLLRAQVTQLQGRVRSHLSSGCHISAAGAPAPPPPPPPEGAAEPAAPETSAC